jgi:hypothetical protein
MTRENGRKFGPEGSWTAPEGAGRDARETAEASDFAPNDWTGLAVDRWTAPRPTVLYGRDC